MKRKVMIFKTVLCSLLLSFPFSVAAQDSVVHGDIEFEGDAKVRDPYSETRDDLIARLSVLSQFTAKPISEPDFESFALGEPHFVHLNALYLYCSVKKGTCPDVLDTVLELDIIQSQLEGNAECSHMKHFWKTWIANDMQRRHQFQVKTGFLKDTEDFKKTTLPRYLRCSQTVAEELKSTKKTATTVEFFTNRYYLPSVPRQAITNTLGLLEEAKKNNINLLFVTGTKR